MEVLKTELVKTILIEENIYFNTKYEIYKTLMGFTVIEICPDADDRLLNIFGYTTPICDLEEDEMLFSNSIEVAESNLYEFLELDNNGKCYNVRNLAGRGFIIESGEYALCDSGKDEFYFADDDKDYVIFDFADEAEEFIVKTDIGSYFQNM